MLRFPLTLLSVLTIGITASSLSAHHHGDCCRQPRGSAAEVVASPCPESSCMTMDGCAEIGTWLRFETVSKECNVFVLGLPAAEPSVVAPDVLICNDGVTTPKLYVGEICIFTTLPCGVFEIQIPDEPALIGIDMVAQHFWLRDNQPTGTSSVVLGFTIKDDADGDGCSCGGHH